MIEALLSLLGLLIATGVSLYAIREMKQARASIPSLGDFIKEGEDGETIIRADVVSLIDAFGSRMAKSLKMSFLQGMGATAKIEKGLKGAIAQDIIEEKMPLLNLAGDILGFNTKQYIAKHPDALGQLIQLAGPLLQGGNLGSLMKGGAPKMQSQNNGGLGGYE